MGYEGRKTVENDSANHLYAENFVLSQTFPVPVQAQRGQRPTLVWPEPRTRRGV
jgi:hypothetical protein